MAGLPRLWQALPGALGSSRRFGGESQPYPVCTCHFCNSASHVVPPHPELPVDVDQIGVTSSSSSPLRPTASPLPTHVSTGTPERWYCVHCTCWNRTDTHDVAGIASWDPAMADARYNRDARAAAGATKGSGVWPNAPLTRPNASPFCHTCQTNQMLLLSMRANYGEDETLQPDANEAGDFEGWYNALQTRYPPVCEACQENVDERIQAADRQARKLIYNGWLRRQQLQQSRVRSVGSSEAPSARSSSSKPVRDTHEYSTLFGVAANGRGPLLEQSSVGLLWYLRATTYLLNWILTASTSLLIERLQRVVGPPFLAALTLTIVVAALHLPARSWDPGLPRRIAVLRRRSPDTAIRVEGLEQWQITQRVLLLMRLAHIVGSSISISRTSLHWKFAVPWLMLQAYLTYRAYSALDVRAPPKVSLRSHSLASNGSTVSKRPRGHAQGFGQALGALSLQQQHDRASDGETERIDDDLEDSMDWSPTLPAAHSNAAQACEGKSTADSSSWSFGPQRMFGPAKDTGLEELVSSRLALTGDEDSEEMLQNRSSAVQDAWPVLSQRLGQRWKLSFALALAIALCSLAVVPLLRRDGSVTASAPFWIVRTISSNAAKQVRAWWSAAAQASTKDALSPSREPHTIWRAAVAAGAGDDRRQHPMAAIPDPPIPALM